jgi:hypothetical protein
MTDVLTVQVDHLSPAQIRTYVIADNRLAEKAGWDRELLALELQELSVEPNFDVMLGTANRRNVFLYLGIPPLTTAGKATGQYARCGCCMKERIICCTWSAGFTSIRNCEKYSLSSYKNTIRIRFKSRKLQQV